MSFSPQLVIRPRGLLAQMDLAIVLIQRYPFQGLLLASLGILPFLLFNLWLFSTLEREPILVYFSFWLYFIEYPWAMMFVTPYLGQVAFEPRPRLRRVIRDIVRSFPNLAFFQGLVRPIMATVAFGIFFLIPMLPLRTHFTSEVLLLERGKFRDAWRRLGEFHSTHGGTIFARAMAEALIGAILIYASYAALYYLSGLLFGSRHNLFFPPDLMRVEEEEAWFIVFPYSTLGFQLCIWWVLTFLCIVRFLSYLDCRTRQEGWDLQVKFHALASRYRQEME